MTEADEVAANMLPGFLVWRERRWKQGRVGRVADYVARELSATESYVVMDNVTETLERLVRENDK